MSSKLPKLALLLTMVLITACTPSPNPMTACEEQLLIDGSKAFTQQLVVPDRAAPMLIRAEAFPTDSPRIDIDGLQEYQVNEHGVLWTDENQEQMMIDEEFFSDLQTQDVVGVNSVKSLGSVSDAIREAWGYDKLIRFLLESEIIRTYWHLEAELCLEEVHETEAVYEQRFSAVHRYCTNECTEDEYRFAVRIEKDSGKIQVRPL